MADDQVTQLDPYDRDQTIRTIIGEAGNQPDMGKVAVAHVILNRSNNTGLAPSQVVHQPNQFEAWQRQNLNSISPNDPKYQSVGNLVDAAAGGKLPDPTNGATQFYAPAAQAALGRNPPSFAKGRGLQIAGHVFYGGQTMPKTSDDDDLINSYLKPEAGTASVPPPPPVTNDNSDDALIKSYLKPEETTVPSEAITDTAPPLTVHAGTLANSPTDTDLTEAAKNVATGAIKGVGDAAGTVGNTGNMADYLVARGENALTGTPTADVQTGLQQNKLLTLTPSKTGNSVYDGVTNALGKLAYYSDPRNVFPSGQDISNPILAQTGEYTPSSTLGRMAQAGIETAVGSLGPGSRGTPVGNVPNALAHIAQASPGLVRTGAQIAATAPLTAVSGATSQGVTEATGDPLLGLAAGAVPGVLASGANRLVSGVTGNISPSAASLADTARTKYNIPLTSPDISSSGAMKYGNSALKDLPFSGAAAQDEVKTNAFNRALSNQMGEDSDKITPDVMQSAKKRLGNEFNVVAQNTNIADTKGLGNSLRPIMIEAAQVLPEADIKPLQAQIENIADVIKQNNGTIPGASYQALTRKGTPLDRAMSSTNPNVSYYAGQIRSALDDALQANATPEMQNRLTQARTQYKAMKTIEPLAEKAKDGNISPALLQNRVSNSYGNLAYNGGGDMGELARIGQQFMKEPPQSGTAPRQILTEMAGKLGAPFAAIAGGNYAGLSPLATAGGALGTIAAGRGVRAVLNSNALTNRLINNSLGRTPTVGTVGRLTNPLAPSAFLQTESNPLISNKR